MPTPSIDPGSRDNRVIFLGVAACLAALGIHARSLVRPYLYHDDFGILLQSFTWTGTRDNLWTPVNEHCWPLTRLAAWVVVQLAGNASGLPLAAALTVRVALLSAMLLIYLFVRRERGHPFFGLAGMILFGVSAVYQEAVYWFAASPALIAGCATLMALLSAQRWLQNGRYRSLLWSAFWSVIAPGWFAGGVLAGPLCVLYLLSPGEGRRWRWINFIPLLGTLAYLGISVPLAGDRILHTAHYETKTAVEAFQIDTGAVNTGRSLVDNLLLGAVGITGITCPIAVVVIGLILLAGVGVWWWRRAASRRLIVLGLGFIFLSDLLIYGARANFPYDTIRAWSRYNVWPWFGVTLIACGGLSRQCDPREGEAVSIGARECRFLAWAIVALFLVQLPRGIIGSPSGDPAQADVLQQVDRMDARCRANRISAADARLVLAPVPLPGYPEGSAWVLLRGSNTPSPMPDPEVRRALLAD